MGIHRNGLVLNSANVYVFIPVVLFIIKIVKNYQKWVYIEIDGIFLLET